ncbi:tRNA (adenosine(37)-N6)-threonylcarbamoyltransferase complex dimerization subunit type 1 TsaB [Alteromonas sp. LMIT006]|uniref:tRNA (adenosine(37)-N6)-threonylcarbamoyltransferase complex dimerization subunit type 1 TsaB n=1 Tax=Alteromonadaceae TaxID=72275 RepID=UPI0020CA8889|nr:tRNA (adenosine(37)-N6)-threonylcarbamoyltransferase complex dimerization subunit type 1 TsaB [Alteromonas sp. LMIT006]UTP72530.1 tRNA (adenosine(37)-N6)-threonylcarbamoyltransferase complex dimerization subunit type 1 TsaB [Alteromonas sp. LMIT006]
MKNILAIDTATEACSVALQTKQGVFSRWEECPQQHAQKLLGMIDEVLKDAELDKSAIDGIAFGQGPGSFTGVRIATAHCQGLALGLDIPVVGISTLATLAQNAVEQPNGTDLPKTVISAIDARMGEVYFAQYHVVDGLVVLNGAESVLAPLDARAQLPQDDFVAVGTGWQAYPELGDGIQVTYALPDARNMLALAVKAFADGQGQAVEDIAPQYVRDTVTWKKLPGR